MPDESNTVNFVKNESVNVELVPKAVLKKTGGSGPFVMKGTAWRDICDKHFRAAMNRFFQRMVNVIKTLFTEKVSS